MDDSNDDGPAYDEGRTDYDALAYGAIRDLIDREDAVIWSEVEAKLSDHSPFPNLPKGLDPHHLVNARRALTKSGIIRPYTDAARGGRPIKVYGLASLRRRETAFNRAAGRKRLLQTRFIGWTEESRDAPNLIGVGGETVVRASPQAAAANGVCSIVGGALDRDTADLFNKPIPGGPVDAAARYILPSDDTDIVIMTIIEVKNIRNRIYPATDELYQVLDKAAKLQIAHPRRRFSPILVCRRAHYLTFLMAKHLGFFVIEIGRPYEHWPQFILPHWTADIEAVADVRNELAYELLVKAASS